MIVAHDAPARWLGEDDTLDADRVIAGFSCAVADVFAGIARGGAPDEDVDRE